MSVNLEGWFYAALIVISLGSSRLLFQQRSLSFAFALLTAIVLASVGLSTFFLDSLTAASLGVACSLAAAPGVIVELSRRRSRESVAARFNFQLTASDGCFCLTFAAVAFAIAALTKMYPTPPGNSVDSAAHFAIVQYFLDYSSPPGAHWNFLWEIASYPFGYHANVAILSRVTGANPIFVLWILPAFLICCCVAICTTMIWETLSKNADSLAVRAGTCVLAALLLYASPYLLETFAGSGFYPMTTELFLVLMLAWMTFPSFQLNLASILVFLLVVVFTPVTYPQWGPFLCLYFAALVFKSDKSISFKLAALTAVALPAGVVGFIFLSKHWEGLRFIFQVEGWSMRAPVFLTALALVGGVGLVFAKDLRKSNLVILIGACLLEALGLIASKSSSGFGAVYHLYKFAYILAPLGIVLACACAGSFVLRRDRRIIGFGLFAVCTGLMIANLKHSAGHILTNDDLAAFAWVKANVDRPSIGLLDDPASVSPSLLWGFALTGKPSSSPQREWWVKPSETFADWYARAHPGDVAVVRTEHVLWDAGLPVTTLYSSGRVQVIRR